jgi:PadR family transcriptional regulator, regulatory protein PadR
MASQIRVTAAVAKVLAAFLEDPAEHRYGLDLMRAADQPSGTLYPILTRLVQAGWAVAEWEREHDPSESGRPTRRYYRLTPHGVTAARDAVSRLYEQLSRAGPVPGTPAGTRKPRPA